MKDAEKWISNVMDTRELKAIVFDCDGVLFDTADANRAYYDTVLKHFGKPPLNDAQFVKVHMFTVKEAFEYLFPEMPTVDPVFEFARETGYHPFIQYMEEEPGTRQLLEKLKRAGYIRGIATNRTNTMESVLIDHGMTHLFEMVVTASDVPNAKPAPDELLKIISHYAITPKELLFIGDSKYDEMAAENAGTWFAAFKNPSLDAHFHATCMGDLETLLGVDQKTSGGDIRNRFQSDEKNNG